MSFHLIGSEELVIGFAFAGVSGTAARTAEEALAAFRSVTAGGAARILVLTEQVSALIAQEVMDWQLAGKYPLIVEIPDIEGHVARRTSLIDSIRDAVGLHV